MQQVQKSFEDYKLVAAIRTGSVQDAEEIVKAASEGGIRMFEISMSVPQALKMVEAFSKKEGFLFGVGGIPDGEVAQRVINAGAAFISTNYTDQEIINVAKHNDVYVLQGAGTLTEVAEAHRFGADAVKFFPAGLIGGPDYLREIHRHLPFVKLTAEWGVEPETLFDYLKYCTSLFIHKALYDKSLVRQNNWSEITERAKKMTQKIESLKVVK